MGYRGKVELREEARSLRAAGMTMPDIAAKLGVSRSSVSLWTRDVPLPLAAVGRRLSLGPRPNRLRDARVAEIERLQAEGLEREIRVPESQFRKPYRAVADPTIRTNKHEHGCAYLVYASASAHRMVMGLVDALLSSPGIPG